MLATAAYIHRTQYRDERTGTLTDDYSAKRDDLEWEALFAKDMNDVPEWWHESRERIVNELEKREDRSTRPNDAQLGYHFKVSLPHELSGDERQQLITEWALQQTRRGYVVDIALHKPNPRENDSRNHHAHVLIPMRPIDRDGWGNKIRTPENTRTGFERWKRQNLEDWKEQFSELGAQYLERAGLHDEAERFRRGHLSRPERAKAAHDRGDIAELDRLLDEPQRYLGPAAAAMERDGRRTRAGDINREIEERNKLRGAARDIRLAYALAAGNQDDFLKALSEKDMIVARITKQEDLEQVLKFAAEPIRYVPHYRAGEPVIVTENGEIHRLSPMTTGESWKKIREFTKPLLAHDFPSLTQALEEQKQRSLIPKVDRDAVIAGMMRAPRTVDIPQDAISTWINQHYQHEAGLSRRTAGDLEPTSRTAIPAGANAPHIRGEGAQVWWAYNSSKDPLSFPESLTERGLKLARVTAKDAADSQTEHWAAVRQGGYYPILREGEYIVTAKNGLSYQLNHRSVGHEAREVRAFLAPLDQKQMPSLREVRAQVHEVQLKNITEREQGRSERNGMAREKGVSLKRVAGIGGKVFAPAFALADAFESLFARTITPEERRLAEIEKHEREAATERAERQRSGGRER